MAHVKTIGQNLHLVDTTIKSSCTMHQNNDTRVSVVFQIKYTCRSLVDTSFPNSVKTYGFIILLGLILQPKICILDFLV